MRFKISVKQIAWDGWEAWGTDCPLVRAKASDPLQAIDAVLERLQGLLVIENYPTSENMIQELNAAGWIAEKPSRWKSPDGALWRGPFGAWKAMQQMQANEKGPEVVK